MFDEEDEIAFVLWGVDTGNGSRRDWSEVKESGKDDKWRRMARAAILRMRVLALTD